MIAVALLSKRLCLEPNKVCVISLGDQHFRYFLFQRLHLPPELSETASRDQEDPVLPKQSQSGCGNGAGRSKLDF